jgi:glucose-6-phosphate isomerase
MLTLDLRNLEEDRVGAAHGVDVARETAALGPRLDAAADALLARAHDDAAMLGWISAPGDRAPLDAVRAFVDARRGAYDDVVVLGIGGSALGARAVQNALRPPIAPPDADE